MTPTEIGLGSGFGYVAVGLAGARYIYHNYEWDTYNTDGENIFFSMLSMIVWPVFWLVVGVGCLITAPTKTERQAARIKAADEARVKRTAAIARMERELGIGQPPPLPAPDV